jgi:hypothetical protein
VTNTGPGVYRLTLARPDAVEATDAGVLERRTLTSASVDQFVKGGFGAQEQRTLSCAIAEATDASVIAPCGFNPLWTMSVVVGARPMRVRHRVYRLVRERVEVSRSLEINDSYLK